MQTFRRKPAEVAAAQFAPGERCEGVCLMTYKGCLPEAHVHTPAGPMCVDAGDWIVSRGGRTWVVEADAFDALYEPAPEILAFPAHRIGPLPVACATGDAPDVLPFPGVRPKGGTS